MEPRILVSGGPVHARIDATKIITERSSGVDVMQIAVELAEHSNLIFLGNKETVDTLNRMYPNNQVFCVIHDGFDDYKAKALELAKTTDLVILGAKINDLLPVNPLPTNFPTAGIPEGKVIPIDFIIAPKVINAIRLAAPRCYLVGHQVSSGLTVTEQVGRALDLMKISGANAIIVHDVTNAAEPLCVYADGTYSPVKASDLFAKTQKS